MADLEEIHPLGATLLQVSYDHLNTLFHLKMSQDMLSIQPLAV
ncbi:hypothetical protein KNP414_01209 [Paenibacillus mucilaginosus KNP414]|uniref:Uncharacterized protein n=1 Tax=Paenibacillus mucilaginosus (strain KNP414) TaxID=1036673 RepID=F8FH74_PAEMK|nr:hypothetical protein KNP414_01209 [Paenibacillus mucilaginosus KNP414]